MVASAVLVLVGSAGAQSRCAPLSIEERLTPRPRLLEVADSLWPGANGVPKQILRLLRERGAAGDTVILRRLRDPRFEAWRWAVVWMISSPLDVTPNEAWILAELYHRANLPSRYILGTTLLNVNDPYPQMLALTGLTKLDADADDSLLVRRIYCDAQWARRALDREPVRDTYLTMRFQLRAIERDAARLLGWEPEP